VLITRIIVTLKWLLMIIRILYFKDHLTQCFSVYGWNPIRNPMLIAGMFWVLAMNLWLYLFTYAIIGAVVIVVLVNVTFNSWLNQEMEEMGDESESFGKKLHDCVGILSNLRKCMACVNYYFAVIIIRPIIVLGFLIG